MAWYWVLVETECLTMDHQITIEPELLIMNWVLSDPLSPKVGCVQEHIHHVNGICEIMSRHAPSAQIP